MNIPNIGSLDPGKATCRALCSRCWDELLEPWAEQNRNAMVVCLPKSIDLIDTTWCIILILRLYVWNMFFVFIAQSLDFVLITCFSYMCFFLWFIPCDLTMCFIFESYHSSWWHMSEPIHLPKGFSPSENELMTRRWRVVPVKEGTCFIDFLYSFRSHVTSFHLERSFLRGFQKQLTSRGVLKCSSRPLLFLFNGKPGKKEVTSVDQFHHHQTEVQEVPWSYGPTFTRNTTSIEAKLWITLIEFCLLFVASPWLEKPPTRKRGPKWPTAQTGQTGSCDDQMLRAAWNRESWEPPWDLMNL